MIETTGYIVYDAFNEPLRRFNVVDYSNSPLLTKNALKRFVDNKPDCKIKEVNVNLYEFLGGSLF